MGEGTLVSICGLLGRHPSCNKCPYGVLTLDTPLIAIPPHPPFLAQKPEAGEQPAEKAAAASSSSAAPAAAAAPAKSGGNGGGKKGKGKH